MEAKTTKAVTEVRPQETFEIKRVNITITVPMAKREIAEGQTPENYRKNVHLQKQLTHSETMVLSRLGEALMLGGDIENQIGPPSLPKTLGYLIEALRVGYDKAVAKKQ